MGKEKSKKYKKHDKIKIWVHYNIKYLSVIY